MAATIEKHPRRIVLFSHDVRKVLGCSSSSASRRIKELRFHYNKKDHQEVTIKEYCDFYGLPYHDICEFLKLM